MPLKPSIVQLTTTGADIQAALTALGAAGGGILQLGPGTYTGAWVTAPAHAAGGKMFLSVPSNVTVRGSGWSTILTMPVPGAGIDGKVFVFDDAVGGGVENLQIQGQHSDEASGGTTGIRICGASGRITVKNVLFSGNTGPNALTVGINVDTAGSADLGHHLFTENKCDRLTGTSSGYGYWVHIGRSSYNTISDNSIAFVSGNGRHHVYLSLTTTYNLVSGNSFYGGEWQSIQINNSDSTPSAYNEISNNVINGSKGIWLGNHSRYNTVSGNLVINSTFHGIQTEGAGSYSGTYNASDDNFIVGNTIRFPQYSGIVSMGSSRTTIADNIVDGACITHGSISAIVVSRQGPSQPQVVDNVVSGNIVRGTDHYYAIAVDSSDAPANTAIVGNVLAKGIVTGLVSPFNEYINDGGNNSFVDANVFIGSSPVDSKVSYEDDYVMYEDAVVTY